MKYDRVRRCFPKEGDYAVPALGGETARDREYVRDCRAASCPWPWVQMFRAMPPGKPWVWENVPAGLY